MHAKLAATCTLLLAAASSVAAAPLKRQQAACTKYTLIDTRGTSEPQGPSVGFVTMNAAIKEAVPGGTSYYPVYPAADNQMSQMATDDIVRYVTETLATSPETCFVLEGYSQGAAAVTNSLRRLTGPAFDAVKAVFLIGNPIHRPFFAGNYDQYGGKTTDGAIGLETLILVPGVPDSWGSKTSDVCAQADGVCDALGALLNGKVGITEEHHLYPHDNSTQTLGAKFVIDKLRQG